MEVAIGLGMAVAAIAPLWALLITFRSRSDADYTRGLEQRLEKAQREAEALTATLAELRDENLELMRRVMRQNGGTK